MHYCQIGSVKLFTVHNVLAVVDSDAALSFVYCQTSRFPPVVKSFSYLLSKLNHFNSKFNMMTKLISRGGLIVVEGGDRSGKTTFSKELVSLLNSQGKSAKYLNFPDRNTRIGGIINEYLQSKGELNDETIHLLFSANRWEKLKEIKDLLYSGTTLIVDRYAFSGVAYSTAKGLNLNWCKSPDIGLLKPDRVYFLEIDNKTQASRDGFGSERYEVSEFQEKVTSVYNLLKDSTWEFLDASKPTNELISLITPSLTSLLSDVHDKHIGKLWKPSNRDD